jgi:dienelactone hydrolase
MKKLLSSIVLGVFAMTTTWGFGQARASDESMNKPNYDAVEIRTENGNTSSAAYFDGKNGQVVIFVPGAVFNKESWFFLAERLQKKNVASLSLDGKTPDDVLSSIRYLKEKGFKKIGLVGGSVGGAAVLDALARKTDTRINKVIALAPAGGKPIKSKVIKKLFIVAKNDSLGLYEDVKKLYESSSDPKKFIVFKGSEHAQHLFNSSHKQELTKLIIDFIAN